MLSEIATMEVEGLQLIFHSNAPLTYYRWWLKELLLMGWQYQSYFLVISSYLR